LRFRFRNPWRRPEPLPGDDVATLIQRARDGDREAFEEIAKRHEKKIFWLAYTVTGNLHDAEDITQEVLIKIFRNIGKLRDEDRFKTWLYRITLHASWDYVRKFRMTGLGAEAGLHEDAKAPPASDGLERREIQETILRHLKALAPNERMVFVLRDIEGLEVKRIARIMSISRITVRRHLSNARMKLRGKLGAVFPDLKGRIEKP
jgi:RNA polymerase sigma-70 factor (ECF subfamily)